MTDENMEQLNTDLKDIQQDWSILAEKLGVPQSKIGAIDSEHKQTELKRRAAVRAWYDRSVRPCVKEVVAALKGMDKIKLASQIAEKWNLE